MVEQNVSTPDLRTRIFPSDERQIPLSVKYETSPIWSEVRGIFGVGPTGAAIAVSLYEANLVGRPMVSYSRSRSYYDNKKNHPLLGYRRTVSAIDALDEGGWIEHARQAPGGRQWQSAMRGAPSLLLEIGNLLTTRPDLPLLLPNANICLRDADGKPLDLPRNRVVSRMSRTVASINEALLSTNVRTENGGRLSSPVVRIFNQDFLRGGRFYASGTSWQNIDKEQRKRVTIDNEEVAELDFAALHPAILYAEADAPLPEDCYSIGNWSRVLAKLAVLVLINAPSLASARLAIAHRPEMLETVEDHQMALRTASRLIDDVRNFHRPIAHAFHSDAGARLMRKDSEIAKDVMITLLAQGIVALPVHDSFLVPASKVEMLEVAMLEAANKAGLRHARVALA